MELYRSAYKLVREMVKVREGETVLITADTGSDWDVVEAVAGAVFTAGGKPMVVWHPMPPHVGKAADPYLPLEPLESALLSADVWIELNKSWLLYSTPYDKAVEKGKIRYMCLVGMTREMIVRTVGRVNVSLLLEFQRKLADITLRTRRMRMTTPAGTDLEFENDPERPIFVEGEVQGPGEYMLIGQVDWAPLEETVSGTLVFDGSVYPPEELGLLKEPIFMDIERGKVIKIYGGKEARIFERWLRSFNDPSMFSLAHVSYGCNPGAILTGNVLEDERVWGTLEWGIGNQGACFKGSAGFAKSHTDGICLSPTLLGDGIKILEDGRYVHPELKALERELLTF